MTRQLRFKNNVHYKVVLPKNFDPSKTYPAVVLAFPPGSQAMDMVLTTVLQNWVPEADRFGYIVFVPAAPGGRPFTEAGARVFPEFIELLLHEYKFATINSILRVCPTEAGAPSTSLHCTRNTSCP